MGSVKQLSYAASTRFYLEDSAKGQPWRTTLPFPVQAVATVEEIDEIANTRQVARFDNHDGYYDGTKQAFRGFGYVERWDGELSDENAAKADREARGLHRDDHVAPAYGRTWFHTGAPGQGGRPSDHYRSPYVGAQGKSLGHYYQGVSGDLHLLDSLPESGGGQLSDLDIAESCRALGGQRLRQEIYAWHGPETRDAPGVPFLVREQRFRLRSLQPPHQTRPGVFALFSVEDLTCHYEQQARDPRIEHRFSLETDRLGNVTKSCVVHYPRREAAPDPATPPPASQTDTRATAIVTRFFDPLDDDHDYLFGVPAEERQFELSLNAVMPATGLITRDAIVTATDGLRPEGTAVDGFPPTFGVGAALLLGQDPLGVHQR